MEARSGELFRLAHLWEVMWLGNGVAVSVKMNPVRKFPQFETNEKLYYAKAE